MLFPGDVPAGQRTFSDVFAAVLEGAAARAVVPVENSLAGIVQEVNDLLWERRGVEVVAEYAHPVRHCLLGRPGPVSSAVSHPQALGQCRRWLEARGIEARPFYDTAGAARWVAESGPEGAAAIASRTAAAHYGLQILAEDIQDQPSNQTRFLVLRCRSAEEKGGRDWPPEAAAGWKGALAFAAPHVPGSLAAALEPFSRRGVNLTRLDSRPVPERPFNYLFYLDFEVGDPRVARAAVAELSGRSAEMRLFGVYPPGGAPKAGA